MFKKFCSLGLFTCMMLGSFCIYAAPIPKWAQSELLTAKVSGLTPENYNEILTQIITNDELEQIIDGLEKQCLQVGLTQKEKAVNLVEIGTREATLNRYYRTLQSFEGDMILEEDMLTYMQKAEVVKGDQKGNLNLDKPCTVQDAILFANRIVEDLYSQTGAGAKGFLWKVNDDNNTVYLLGTIHLGIQEMYPFSTSLNNALESADKVVFEVDFNNKQDIAYFLQKQMYLDDTTLKDDLDEETYQRTIKVFNELGSLEENTQKYKPWALANSLNNVIANGDTSQAEQTTTLPIVDVYVYTKALLEDKELLELEGYVFQADLFDSIDKTYQIESLKAGLDAIEHKNNQSKTPKQTDEVTLTDEWVNQFLIGDIEGFTESYNKDAAIEEDDKMMQMLFGGRDDHMTDKVVEYLADPNNNTYFVTVGAGHMVGNQGIVKQLQDLGYTVESVEVR